MLSSKNLTWDIRKQALNYLMFLERKRSGKTKVRGCANRCPQREHITKEESSSPFESLDALMGSCLMDAMDKRKVININIPGAFLQGNWPQDERPKYIMFEIIMVDMICEINPSDHDKIIWSKDRNKKVLYSQLVKAV